MEEGGPSFEKKNFRNLPARDSFLKVRKAAHWGHLSPPRHLGDQGEWSGEVGEENGGVEVIWVEGE